MDARDRYKVRFVNIWKDDRGEHNRSISEIIHDLNLALAKNIPEDWEKAGDVWGFWWHCDDNRDISSTSPWPEYHWIACYAVTGGSEAHYIHLDLISPEGHRHMLLMKCWGGWDVACAVANETARLLGA